jgi:polysaccharide deacetylase family protein (PEP-CTERM system associated)
MRDFTHAPASPAPAAPHDRHNVLGVFFDLVGYEDVLNLIEHWRTTRARRYIVFTPPHSVLLCHRDAELQAATNEAGLVLPDGVGIILAAHLLNYRHHGRVTGPTFMLKLCDWGRQHHYRHYFYGGAEGVAEGLADTLCRKFPGLHMSGTCCPPFRPLTSQEEEATIERINTAEPDIVWVGLGSPKQEKWMRAHVGRIRAAALIGVGAAFDFHSGRRSWAPAPIRSVGLEWMYRFTLEPTRMWPRCITAPQFLLGVVRQRWDSRRRLRPAAACPSHPVGDAPPPRRCRRSSAPLQNAFSVDVEEWFHILRSATAPRREDWSALESRSDANVNRLLDLLHEHGVRATFFWLGWMAEEHKLLLRRCSEAGHEIASHGYHHVLPWDVGPVGFKEDIERARKVLEDLAGRSIHGFRTAGFGVHGETEWAFEVIKEAGYEYDSSVFPSYHSRRCIHHWQAGPYWISTKAGRLVEIPLSAVSLLGYKLFLFGGGYLRLAPQRLIQWGVRQLHRGGAPLIVYVHPREVDPQQPRLPLSALRRFRCYVNLGSTMPKLAWLCRSCTFVPMMEMARELLDPCPAVEKARLLASDSRYDPQSQTA